MQVLHHHHNLKRSAEEGRPKDPPSVFDRSLCHFFSSDVLSHLKSSWADGLILPKSSSTSSQPHLNNTNGWYSPSEMILVQLQKMRFESFSPFLPELRTTDWALEGQLITVLRDVRLSCFHSLHWAMCFCCKGPKLCKIQHNFNKKGPFYLLTSFCSLHFSESVCKKN